MVSFGSISLPCNAFFLLQLRFQSSLRDLDLYLVYRVLKAGYWRQALRGSAVPGYGPMLAHRF